MISVPKLEMHLAYACNLRCQGCTHYSNYALSGVVPLPEGSRWLECWSRRVAPIDFSFLGGEPLVNRDVPAFVRLARRLWPRSRLRLVSNGLLLQRAVGLWEALGETETTLTISIHSREAQYLARLAPNLELARARAKAHDFRLEERNSVERWYKLYRGEGREMRPFDDGDPEASWSACFNKHCLTLQDNALWKCPPLAHLPRVAAEFELEAQPQWQPYLRYEPLYPSATDDEIRAFVSRRAEPACGMCPTTLDYFEKSVM